MFAPVIRLDGTIVFVNPALIQHIHPGVPLDDVAPDGNPWPTSVIVFSVAETLPVKGTPQMILGQWFGRPENEERRVVVPARRL